MWRLRFAWGAIHNCQHLGVYSTGRKGVRNDAPQYDEVPWALRGPKETAAWRSRYQVARAAFHLYDADIIQTALV
jgi:hypothetical protein